MINNIQDFKSVARANKWQWIFGIVTALAAAILFAQPSEPNKPPQ